MKYALIGCGRIAAKHINAVLSNELELVAVCDILPDAMGTLLSKYELEKDNNVRRYTDYKDLINNHPDLQLVSIATDSGLHAEIALYCIDHGINIIVEKPIAMSIADEDEIIRRSEERGVKVSACHQNRFNIAVQKMRKALEDGRFGQLSHGSVHVRWNRGKAYYDQAAWRGKWASDGGALMNQCIHGIDLLRWMLGGEIEEVYGVICQQYHEYLETEDVGMAVLKFKNGVIGTIEGTVNVYPQNLEETLYLFGESGTVKLGGSNTNNIDIWKFLDMDQKDEEYQGLQEITTTVYGNGHVRLFADMVDAIQKNRKPFVDAIDGRNALEVVLAIYKSKKTGKPVRLPLQNFSSVDMDGTFDNGKIID